MTQRSASTRLDLPQPFGPTTPVSPSSTRRSVESTKDLNPVSRNDLNWTNHVPRSAPFAPVAGHRPRRYPADLVLSVDKVFDFVDKEFSFACTSNGFTINDKAWRG